MKWLLILSLLPLTACGEPGLNKEIEEYVHRFEAACGVESTATLGFGPMPNRKWIAFCHQPTREVFLDEPFWKWASDLTKEQLIFHELGHCVLDQLEHRGDSIMRGMLWRDAVYKARRDEFINELCTWEG